MSSLGLFDGIVPFVTVADAGSFREAARRLGVTASAISKAIAKLEAEVGVRLYQRSARRVALTAEGERFLRGCRGAVDAARDAREQLASTQHSPHGRLRVSLPPVFASRIIDALPALLAEYPELVVHVVITDRFVQLVDENVDVAVRIGALENSNYVQKKLRQVTLVTAATPGYLKKHGTPRTPADLARHACIQFIGSTGRPQPWLFAVRGRQESTAIDGAFSADHGEGVLAAALAGVGVVQAPDIMIADRIESGELVRVLATYAALGPPLTTLSAPGRAKEPKVRAFVEFVAALVGKAAR